LSPSSIFAYCLSSSGERGLSCGLAVSIFEDGAGVVLVKAGWDIQATLEQEMNSDLPGDVRGIVRENVYDTATGRYLLIPQGSRVLDATTRASPTDSQRQNNAGAGAVYAQPTINQTISASVGQQIGQLGTSLAQKQLNIQPTITIPIGYRFTIRVRKDLIFDAPYAERQAVWR